MAELGRQVRNARVAADISQASVAKSSGADQSLVSRFERGDANGLTIEKISILLGAVGLDLSIRAYPGGDPLHDRPQLDLLGRLQGQADVSIGWASEVPLPGSGDARAWDALLRIGRERWGVEAETRIGDVQARLRSLQLKRRDGSVDGVILLLRNSAHHRALLRDHGPLLAEAFPTPAAEAMEALRAGRPPPGDAIVLL